MAADRVTFNVGGKLFETTKTTVQKSQHLSSLISPDWKEGSALNTPIFIDRNPNIFKHVLAFLRDPGYHYPTKYVNELDFYLIDYANEEEEEENLEINALTFEASLTNISENLGGMYGLFELLARKKYCDKIDNALRYDKPRAEINHFIKNRQKINHLCIDEIRDIYLQIELKGEYNIENLKKNELGTFIMYADGNKLISVDGHLLYLYEMITHSNSQLAFENKQTVATNILHIRVPLFMANYMCLYIAFPSGIYFELVPKDNTHIKDITFDVQGYVLSNDNRAEQMHQQIAPIFTGKRFEFNPDETGIVNSLWNIRGPLVSYIVIARDDQDKHQRIDTITLSYNSTAQRHTSEREIIGKMLKGGLNFRNNIYYIDLGYPVCTERIDNIHFKVTFIPGVKIKDVIVYAFIGNVYRGQEGSGSSLVFSD